MSGCGACILDNAPPPRPLIDVWNTKRWGNKFATGWNDWSAIMLAEMNAAMNYDNAFQSYKSASKKAEWSKSNTAAWEIVSRYIAEKMEK